MFVFLVQARLALGKRSLKNRSKEIILFSCLISIRYIFYPLVLMFGMSFASAHSLDKRIKVRAVLHKMRG